MDYQCPYCQRAYPELVRLLSERPDQVRLVFRHFPMTTVHDRALPAALAAEAAGRQGRFWEMHQKLFENPGQLADEDLIRYAREIGLDMTRFTQDTGSPELAREIKQERFQGARSGVNGTPTLFVNGERFNQAPDYETLVKVVDKLTAESR